MGKKTRLFWALLLAAGLIFLNIACAHGADYSAWGSMEYFGGPGHESYDPLTMMWWLLIFTPVWALGGAWLDMERQSLGLRALRYRSVFAWWRPLILGLYGMNVCYFIIFGCLLKLWDLWDGQTMMAVFSMAFHSLFMTGIMTVIFLTLKNAVVSFIVPVLCEAVSTIILSLGMPPALLPLVWGMYRYSHDIFGDKGFSIAAVFAVTLVFAAALLLFPLIKRFRRLALRLLV